MDAEAIAQREAEELMKERRELQARLKSQEKKVPSPLSYLCHNYVILTLLFMS
jgi:hypothetical protein